MTSFSLHAKTYAYKINQKKSSSPLLNYKWMWKHLQNGILRKNVFKTILHYKWQISLLYKFKTICIMITRKLFFLTIICHKWKASPLHEYKNMHTRSIKKSSLDLSESQEKERLLSHMNVKTFADWIPQKMSFWQSFITSKSFLLCMNVETLV